MKVRIEILLPKKLLGKRKKMSLTNNTTPELWGSFMPLRKKIQNTANTNLYSLQIYNTAYFENFNPDTEFEKWASVEVTDFSNIPDEMETFITPGSLYAVFPYKGPTNDTRILEYIFSKWLPNSEYSLDDRPHFEILGEKYKNNSPDSEEEIWIPIKPKQQSTSH